MHRYKIGQKVRISPHIKRDTYVDGVYINGDMVAHINSVYIVTHQKLYREKPVYYLKGSCWTWAENMLCSPLPDNFISLNEYV